MSNLQEKFNAHLTETGMNRLLASGALVAWSGGLDSTVLVHLLRGAGVRFSVAHCNFQLRGSESDADEAFVQALANEWGLPCFCKKFETKAYATAQGISIQMAARQLRYEWFGQIIAQAQLDTLLTAHHANDHAETLLIHWLRGTGLKGLAGIPPVLSLGNQYTVVRPLLPFPRVALEAYAALHQLQWREDSSNAKDDYLRNYLRHQIVPKLEAAQPALLPTLYRNSQHIRQSEQNYAFLLAQFVRWQQPETGVYTLDIALLKALPSPAAALWEILHPFGFTAEQTRQISTLLEEVGQDFKAESGARVVVDRKLLILRVAETHLVPEIHIGHDDLMVKIPDLGQLFFTETDSTPFPDGKKAIAVDPTQLKYPLLLRLWKAGDAFQPFGMQGQHQKIQDFLTNQKISRLEKEQVRVLVNGDGKIIWVVGFRMDERFKVPKTNQTALKITLITQN